MSSALPGGEVRLHVDEDDVGVVASRQLLGAGRADVPGTDDGDLLSSVHAVPFRPGPPGSGQLLDDRIGVRLRCRRWLDRSAPVASICDGRPSTSIGQQATSTGPVASAPSSVRNDRPSSEESGERVQARPRGRRRLRDRDRRARPRRRRAALPRRRHRGSRRRRPVRGGLGPARRQRARAGAASPPSAYVAREPDRRRARRPPGGHRAPLRRVGPRQADRHLRRGGARRPARGSRRR